MFLELSRLSGIAALVLALILPTAVVVPELPGNQVRQDNQHPVGRALDRNIHVQRSIPVQSPDEEPHVQNVQNERRNQQAHTACEQRRETVERVMDRQVRRGGKFIELFTTISRRVQSFYEQNQLETEDYEEAVDEVRAKQMKAVELLNTLTSSNHDFDCDDNPGEVVTDFRRSHRALIETLKEYRSSVVSLIVLVRTTYSDSQTNPEGTNDTGGDEPDA